VASSSPKAAAAVGPAVDVVATAEARAPIL
jgi:hypothetical protein